MPHVKSQRSSSRLTAELLRLMQQQPGEWTADRFVTELGESESRIYRTLAEIESAGWQIERSRDGNSKRLSVSAGTGNS